MKNIKTRFICLFFLCSISSFIAAQEICDNAIDDDGDGLIDLNDPDCACDFTDFILNASFEDTLCCPNQFSLLACANNWVQASNGSSDYYHTCADILTASLLPNPPTTMEQGNNGFAGFLNGFVVDNRYKEYIGTCVSLPLEKDTTYIFSFLIGFGRQKQNSGTSSKYPIKVTLYGHTECNALPFSGRECPLNSDTPNWTVLGSVNVEGKNEWKVASISFSPIFDIAAIAIGPDCAPFPHGNHKAGYYFLDDAYIDKASRFIQLLSGLPCTGDAILGITPVAGNSYQWYFNGEAILGANLPSYQVPAGSSYEGLYQVLLEDGSECQLSPTYSFVIDGFPVADLEQDSFICPSETLTLGSKNLGDHFLWNTNETSQTISITESGLYAVTVTNECGLSSDEVLIQKAADRPSCQFELPTVFTPNADGINDRFRPITTCCITAYELKIFSQWGQIVFSSTNPDHAWDGTFQNKQLPASVFVWQISYSIIQNNTSKRFTKAGDLTLIR